jgi:hypothetical protein
MDISATEMLYCRETQQLPFESAAGLAFSAASAVRWHSLCLRSLVKPGSSGRGKVP